MVSGVRQHCSSILLFLASLPSKQQTSNPTQLPLPHPPSPSPSPSPSPLPASTSGRGSGIARDEVAPALANHHKQLTFEVTHTHALAHAQADGGTHTYAHMHSHEHTGMQTLMSRAGGCSDQPQSVEFLALHRCPLSSARSTRPPAQQVAAVVVPVVALSSAPWQRARSCVLLASLPRVDGRS